MSEKYKKVPFVTPIGVAQYPWLKIPDTQFNADGVYQSNIVFDAEVADDLIKLIDDTVKEAHGTSKNVRIPYSVDEDTGQVTMKVKSNYAPVIFDCDVNILTGKKIPAIWGGSQVIFGGTISPYNISGTKGIKLQMSKVQLIEVVSGDPAHSFGVVDGGFTVADGADAEEDILETAGDANDEAVEEGDF